MLRKTLASSRALRVGVLGLVTVTTAILISDSAEARRYRHRHHVRHSQESSESNSSRFASIIVDGNSGAVLTATSPDGLRHPASLTKIMTLYLLFERLDAGKMKLDTEMPVSEHAADQDPTKLGLRPGSTIRVEDAIKGLVTRSANDAAVVIAEAIGGSEDDFARMMTRKARALGMSRTVYRNASGLPNDEQITTARDQSILGRAIQDRFPRYYRYFSTTAFNFRGRTITGHNRLLGKVEGVDGIKTGYTRASGFNLVTSMHRGNRFLVGVVLGGRSGGSRDAIMRNLLAENLSKAATIRTAAAITERNPADARVEVADADSASRADTSPAAASEPASAAMQPARPAKPSLMAAAAAALPPLPAKSEPQAKPEPAPLTSGVIQTQPIAAIPGSAEPMKPVKVKTVQVRAGQIKLAAGPAQSAPPITSTIPQRSDVAAETSHAMMARAAETSRPEMPPQPANFGTGNGILGVLPASAVQSPPPPAPQAMASVEPARSQPSAAIKPAAPIAHSGWIVQVGALETEGEAKQRIDLARSSARGLLSKADPFTEVVAKDNRKLYRARFAGLERDQAEQVCRTLKRADISCITVRN
ncbi:D-alanyl-D-alanine carboxypeptidase [Bradyrhizobium sp. WSM 1704]|uniref:D-alanyl-D-alanine carboxypeptidase n=1 Tax=Bradyrhizobium semiaridum TaxID=2821404 RepID=UPI001CE27039|nr:D-alanyl-D-alanine carboxypeptidase [Bradyrhizobium semiaridum]MCA6122683.1 D-alanyl-D-alanine carboxypeptidase [Bradyrhizobium semiaridum]